MRLIRFIAIGGICFTLCSCISMPTRFLPISEEHEISKFGTATIIGCENSTKENEGSSISCDKNIESYAYLLNKLNIFETVTTGDNDKADYLITIKPYYRAPYYTSITHNPGFFVLSIVIPFWEKYKYGEEFIIRNKKTNEIYNINTIEEGKLIMWSGSIIINLFPNRGIPATNSQSEKLYLRNSIINKLTE